jgi:limonene-1,2-epoxide hydrolase
MKRIFSFAILILVVMSLTYNGKAASDKKVVEKFFAAYNSQDMDKAAAYFSEDTVYEDVTAGHISRGRAEVRKRFEGAFYIFEDFKLEVVSNSFHKGHGVVEWVWSGTDKEMLKTGKKFSVRGVSVYEIRRGKISRYKEFYDFATVMRQVGVLPAEKE